MNLLFGITEEWLLALLVFVSTFLILLIAKKILAKRFPIGAVRELIGATRWYFVLASSFAVASLVIDLPAKQQLRFERFWFLIFLLQFMSWGVRAVDFWISRLANGKNGEKADLELATSLNLVRFFARVALFITLVLLGINNFGFNVSTLVAGLGVSGVALALGVQKILSDIFASLTLVLDKPFVVGDFISVGEFSGTVEALGLKTTRLKSVTGEQIIFSNGDLLQSRIRNFKRMKDRRHVLRHHFNLDSELCILENWPKKIEALFKKEAYTDLELERYYLQQVSQYAIEFELNYWVKTANFDRHTQLLEQINYDVLNLAHQDGLKWRIRT